MTKGCTRKAMYVNRLTGKKPFHDSMCASRPLDSVVSSAIVAHAQHAVHSVLKVEE